MDGTFRYETRLVVHRVTRAGWGALGKPLRETFLILGGRVAPAHPPLRVRVSPLPAEHEP